MMKSHRERLIIFTRYPEAGRVKTRLIPALTAEGAAALHRRLTLRALRLGESVRALRGVDLEIRFDGGSEAAMRHWLGDGKIFRPQGEGDLGARMFRAFVESFSEGSPATLIIGADCPELTIRLLAEAFEALSNHPVVFGPAIDGGYYLVGLTHAVPEVFRGPNWGTETVLADSLKILEPIQLKPALLDRLGDIDRPEDLPTWNQIAELEDAGLTRISVIIPALNEGGQIATTIASAKQCVPHEIIVVDGGSTDETAARAVEAGAVVLNSSSGRARQMNAGAARATGNVLLFLHADTQLPADWARNVSEILEQPKIAAGAFRFRIGANFPGKRLVECATNLRSRWLQMPYGDQALFMRRALFEEIGGFADLPIMEDYELVRQLRRRGRITITPQAATTSGRRWRRLGLIRTTTINWLVVLGYHCGVAPDRLGNFYRGQ